MFVGGDNPERDAARRALLARAGAHGQILEELLAANAPRLSAALLSEGFVFPLPDEAQVEVWEEYVDEARRCGVLAALVGRVVQLSFPIQAGISQTPAYLAATRRGELTTPRVGLELTTPDELQLELAASLGGRVPVLTAARREDFVTLVRALAGRNEPIGVPASMGACLVAGLANWDRVRRHRQRWQAAAPDADEAAWGRELRALAERKELYQDRLVLLSRGPYSGVSAAELGLGEEQWEALSLRVRHAHECTHYLTLRVFGRLQHNVLEEVLADFAGVWEAFGEYPAALAQRLLGVDGPRGWREGGRLANYRGKPPLSDEALAVQADLVRAAIHTLATVATAHRDDLATPHALGSLLCRAVTLSLEELAAASPEVLMKGVGQP